MVERTENLYVYIKTVIRSKKRYRYLVIEEYRKGKRKVLLMVPVKKLVSLLLSGCGGWDSNPRRPTPSGPQPDPFDLARAPPHQQES